LLKFRSWLFRFLYVQVRKGSKSKRRPTPPASEAASVGEEEDPFAYPSANSAGAAAFNPKRGISQRKEESESDDEEHVDNGSHAAAAANRSNRKRGGPLSARASQSAQLSRVRSQKLRIRSTTTRRTRGAVHPPVPPTAVSYREAPPPASPRWTPRGTMATTAFHRRNRTRQMCGICINMVGTRPCRGSNACVPCSGTRTRSQR